MHTHMFEQLLQIQPEKEIVVELIKNEDFKYVRALGAFYMRMVGKPLVCVRVCVCVCVSERERERVSEKGRVPKCMFVCVYACVFVFMYVPLRANGQSSGVCVCARERAGRREIKRDTIVKETQRGIERETERENGC